MTGKFDKIPNKFSLFDHMLLDGHKVNFDNFSILLKETHRFKLQLKKHLLISLYQLILNKIFTLFSWKCLIDYNIVTFVIFIVISVIPYQYIIIVTLKFTVKLLQFK